MSSPYSEADALCVAMAKGKRPPRELSKKRLIVMAAAEAAQKLFGQRVRVLRKQEPGLTQAKLGDRIDISQKYISEIERGLAAPSFEALVGISRIGLGRSTSVLTAGIDGPRDPDAARIEDLLADLPAPIRTAVVARIESLITLIKSILPA